MLLLSKIRAELFTSLLFLAVLIWINRPNAFVGLGLHYRAHVIWSSKFYHTANLQLNKNVWDYLATAGRCMINSIVWSRSQHYKGARILFSQDCSPGVTLTAMYKLILPLNSVNLSKSLYSHLSLFLPNDCWEGLMRSEYERFFSGPRKPSASSEHSLPPAVPKIEVAWTREEGYLHLLRLLSSDCRAVICASISLVSYSRKLNSKNHC